MKKNYEVYFVIGFLIVMFSIVINSLKNKIQNQIERAESRIEILEDEVRTLTTTIHEGMRFEIVKEFNIVGSTFTSRGKVMVR